MSNLFPEFGHYRDILLWWKWSLCPHPQVYPQGAVSANALTAALQWVLFTIDGTCQDVSVLCTPAGLFMLSLCTPAGLFMLSLCTPARLFMLSLCTPARLFMLSLCTPAHRTRPSVCHNIMHMSHRYEIKEKRIKVTAWGSDLFAHCDPEKYPTTNLRFPSCTIPSNFTSPDEVSVTSASHSCHILAAKAGQNPAVTYRCWLVSDLCLGALYFFCDRFPRTWGEVPAYLSSRSRVLMFTFPRTDFLQIFILRWLSVR